MSDDPSLADRILGGDVRAASRLMRRVDDGHPDARATLETLFEHSGNASIVGITGHPGSGKSTLVNKFIAHCRERDLTVGCIAIDPTSPFTGGAILGDRVRMNEHALDEGVFIRSVATRGNLGGLSRSTPALVVVMDAMGFDIVLIETVGVGQDEIDIVQLADTNVVVTVPGLGDDIQANKAGLLEIADVFSVNKYDLDGARNLERQLKTMLRLGEADDEEADETWTPPLVPTVATTGKGVEDLYEAIEDHRDWMESQSLAAERKERRLEQLVRLVIRGEFDARLAERMRGEAWEETLQNIVDRRESPYAAADKLLDNLFSD
ncbi:MAG: methylmalonyl Co-A mutase-associated GTPase MeaB [Bradymonadaceae bacterium]